MQRMSGIDPMFVYADTPATPMEVAYACVLDPTSVPGGYSFQRVRDVLTARVPALPALRRRLMAVPFGLDVPRLVDDPDLDLSDHLYRAALPAPGGPEEFARMVSEVMSRPLQPDQPPWEMHVIEGLADGRVGLIAKVHHAVVDGVAGAQLMAQLLDLAPEGSEKSSEGSSAKRSGDASSGATGATETPPSWLPARLPSGARLLTDALPNFVTSPLRAWRAGREVGHTAARLVGRAVNRGHGTRVDPPGSSGYLRGFGWPATGGGLRRVGPPADPRSVRTLRRQGERRGARHLLRCLAIAPGRPWRRSGPPPRGRGSGLHP